MNNCQCVAGLLQRRGFRQFGMSWYREILMRLRYLCYIVIGILSWNATEDDFTARLNLKIQLSTLLAAVYFINHELCKPLEYPMNSIFDCLSFASAPVLVFSFAKFAPKFGLFVLRWAFPVVPLLADIARAFGVIILPF